MNTNKQHLDDLLEHLLKANSKEQLEVALQMLLTPAELNEVPKRLQIFKMLKAGVPQREIAKELGVGIATVTRGSREFKSGTINMDLL